MPCFGAASPPLLRSLRVERPLHPDLLPRARAAQRIGFTVLEAGSDHFLAGRMRWHWDCFARLYTLVAVRRAGHVTGANLKESSERLTRAVYHFDHGRIPRGFQVGRCVLDIVLAESIDDSARSFLQSTWSKSIGQFGYTVIVLPDGEIIDPKPFYGRAYMPKITHVYRTIARLDTTEEPIAVAAAVIGWVMMMPGIVLLVFSCCGLPVPWVAYQLWREEPPKDILPPP